MKSTLLLALFLILGFSESSYSLKATNEELDLYFDSLKNYQFNEAIEIAESSSDENSKELILLAQLLKHNGYPLDPELNQQIENLDFKNHQNQISEILLYLIRAYYIMADPDSRSDAFELLTKGKVLAEEIDQKNLLKLSLLGILRLYSKSIIHPDDMFRVYLDAYKSLCEDPVDSLHYYSLLYNLYNLTGIYGQENEHLVPIYKLAMASMDSLRELIPDDNKVLIHYYTDKAGVLSKDDAETAKDLYLKALEYTDNSIFYNSHKFSLTLHLARVNINMSQYRKALDYANKSKEFLNPNDSLKDSLYVSAYKAEIHAALGNYDSAYVHMYTSRYLEFQLDFQKENAQIAKLEIENNTKQKELENLELKTKNTRNNYLLLASLIVIILGSLIAVLIYKNAKRKQLLAENEKNLQNQKLSTVLKEQELRSIDAMIEGQEKERQRIANDLHDDLGSVMSNLKLHINALKDSKSEELYLKTDKLVDEAYNKVRMVSHAKNSGVMAKLGLLKAVQNMAKTMSATNKIDIQVVYHGLEERLENSLELTIFRIIQELITNVLKHAEAKEVTINLIQHDDSLNIMVEDDGIGFKTTNITTSNSGMGLSSIDKRVEHLNGELTIESELGKGTTIIIDIPI